VVYDGAPCSAWPRDVRRTSSDLSEYSSTSTWRRSRRWPRTTVLTTDSSVVPGSGGLSPHQVCLACRPCRWGAPHPTPWATAL